MWSDRFGVISSKQRARTKSSLYDRQRNKQATCYYLAGLLTVAFVLASNTVYGQDRRPDVLPDLEQSADDHRDKPWIDKSVPLERRHEARVIFLQATELLQDGLFVEAEERYLKALVLLDHPGIRYNLAIAQLNLKGKPIESYNNFGKAMAFGPGPLGEEKYEQARNYRALLGNQLVELEIICPTEGAEVTLNGKRLFTGPDSYRHLVVVGEYSIVASKSGFTSDSQRRMLTAGQKIRVLVEPRPISNEPLPPRWAPWKPWALAAAGGIIILGGGVLHSSSNRRFGEFDKRFRVLPCAEVGLPEGERSVDGCKPGSDGVDSGLENVRKRAVTERRAALIAYGVGGAATIAGLILVTFNQPRMAASESKGTELSIFSLTLNPSEDGVRFTAAFRF